MNQKLGFFKRIYLAATDFRVYPFVQKEKMVTAFSYFLKLLLILSLICSVFLTVKVVQVVEIGLENYDESVPMFTLKDGSLTVLEKIQREENNVLLSVDTDYSNQEFITDNESLLAEYDFFYLINKDGIVYGTAEASQQLPFQQNLIMTKESMKVDLTNLVSQWTVQAMLGILFFATILILYIIVKVINILILTLVAYIFNMVFRIKLNFKNYIRIACYALTIPIIIETIAILVTGSIADYTYITYQLLSYVYVFYAMRAVALDAVIMAGPKGGSVMQKVENAIEKLTEELKKETDEEQKQEEEKEEEKEKEE